jgi:hypothetical protein
VRSNKLDLPERTGGSSGADRIVVVSATVSLLAKADGGSAGDAQVSESADFPVSLAGDRWLPSAPARQRLNSYLRNTSP